MTKLLDDAIAEIRRLPEPQQDEIATIMLELASEGEDDLHLTPEQIQEVRRRLGEPDDFVSDEEMKAFFARLGA